ncbi:MAG: diguanylate cyclase [Pseudomonadota bacterium]
MRTSMLRHLIATGIFLLTASGFCADGPPQVSLHLAPEERSYIDRAGSIKMCVDPDWVPFERLDKNGRHEGIAADLVQLVAQRLGIKIEAIQVKDWDESLQAARAGRCQILSFLNQTPEREQWLIFTDPIFFDPNVIITREEHDFIAYPQGLKDHSVAVPRDTMVEERLRNDYPNLQRILTDSEQESIALVSDRKADMTVRSLIVAAYTIKKEGLFNLKIAGQLPKFTNELRIGVLNDNRMLRDILNKGVKTLTPQDREQITNRHVSMVVQKGVDYSLVWKILAASVLVLLVVIYWNRKLSTLNRELDRLSNTDKLTGLYNRIKLDRVFEDEVLRADRSSRPFSIILLDLDHFKEVNDLHGHQVGDSLLVEIASLMRLNTREIDVVGRWGGEEFLIICPETDASGVFTLAENLRHTIEEYNFPVIRQKTASFGLTTYRKGDKVMLMVARADAALYQAKGNGRNQVAVS